jgi:AcrR family transcriptional regulator
MSGEASQGADDAEADVPDTRDAILDATYAALCKHGYADLTMQTIADESDVSKSALHYHFDTKDELLLAFLDRLYEWFTEEHADPEGEHAVERLVTFVDGILCWSDVEEAEQFQTALLEIKAQSPYVDAYREKLERVDRWVRDCVEEILTDGIEEGVVREDVDTGDAAAFIVTLIVGVNTRRVTVSETGGGTRRTFRTYVREHLVAPDADVEVPA